MRRAFARWNRAGMLVAGLVGLASLGGCASPRTTLVLLPDDDGKIGQVTIDTSRGRQTIDQAFSASTVTDASAAPSPVQPLGQTVVDARFGQMLAAQPKPPRTFTLYFVLDQAVLTDTSKAMLPELLRAVRERKPAQISLFGHADASGTRERNLKLSAERARVVAEWLRNSDPALERLDVRAFGSAEPLNEPGVTPVDPRNRRVEVLIL